jgi:molybdopterin molybdotransferase
MTPPSLIEIEEAVGLVVAECRRLPSEQVELAAAAGRVLADDVEAPESVPGWDNSAMDGYAVIAADTGAAGAESPVKLRLAGESRAGAPLADRIQAGTAAAISTGAVVPAGADAVVRAEDARVEDGMLIVSRTVGAGTDIRRAGEDVAAGDRVLAAGARLGAAELGVLAGAGVARPAVVRRPRVAVLSTGDELIGPDEPMRPGAVRNSNAHTVPAQVRAAGAELVSVAMVPDDPQATNAALAGALAGDGSLGPDLVVVCGGVSVGAHDHVRPALEDLGVEQRFWGVSLRPGKPTWFGVRTGAQERTLVFGLPGNPVSAMVTFDLFARAAIARMLGDARAPRTLTAVLDEPYRKSPGRTHVVRLRARVEAGRLHVRPSGDQASHRLTSMLGVDALAILPTDAGDVAAGSEIEVRLVEPPALF